MNSKHSIALLAALAALACGQAPKPAPAPSTLAPDGGPLSELVFAVVGDTRPPNSDENGAYPTQVITKIYQDVQALSPHPAFVIATGDYQYTTPGNGNAQIQIGYYATAMKLFDGPIFAAMGNHECTGYTSSNCGSGSADGLTTNYTQFLSQILGPIQQAQPYYSIPLHAGDGSWTAKIVVIAANAWDDAQASWLTQTLQQPTTYTFVVRHEPTSADTAPGTTPSAQILSNQPYTLLLVGHTHSFEHPSDNSSGWSGQNCRCDTREIIIGNGGAGYGPYGFGLVTRQTDGNITLQQYDESSNAPTGISFTVTPAGAPVG